MVSSAMLKNESKYITLLKTPNTFMYYLWSKHQYKHQKYRFFDVFSIFCAFISFFLPSYEYKSQFEWEYDSFKIFAWKINPFYAVFMNRLTVILNIKYQSISSYKIRVIFSNDFWFFNTKLSKSLELGLKRRNLALYANFDVI